MISVFVNVGTVLLGGALGLLLKKGIPERISKAVMSAIGLCTVYIGIDGALKGNNTVVLIVSMVFGTVVGNLIDIDRQIGRLGEWIEKKFSKKKTGGVSLAEGFMTGSLLFCVGAMTVVGSLNAGLSGDHRLIYTKSVLDMISSCMLASTLGAGVLFSAVFVLFYQGGLVLLSGLLQNVLTDEALIAQINCAGSVMIIGLGLNILGITKLKVANFLPALLFVPLVSRLFALLPLTL